MLLVEKFERRAVKSAACWRWRGAHNDAGYAQMWWNGKVHRAARIAYLLYVGTIPQGVYVCHSCDNPGCVNPAHLFPGTQSDNMKDSVRKGRHMNTKKTHCPLGHEFTPENTYHERRGSRVCKRCRSDFMRRKYLRKRNPDVQRLIKEGDNAQV